MQERECVWEREREKETENEREKTLVKRLERKWLEKKREKGR